MFLGFYVFFYPLKTPTVPIAHSQQNRLGGKTSGAQCDRHCCHSKHPNGGTLLSPGQTVDRRSLCVQIQSICVKTSRRISKMWIVSKVLLVHRSK